MCKAAIGSMGDIATGTGAKFADAVPNVMQALMAIIQSPNVDRSLYPHCFAAFGDIALAVGGSILPYAESLATLVQQAMMTKADMTDEDQVDYLCELQYGCFVCISDLTTALSSSGNLPALVQVLPKFTEAIYQGASNTQRTPDLDKAIIGCVSDLFTAAGKWTVDMVKPGGQWEKLPEVINHIRSHSTDPGVQEECTSTLQQLQACFSTGPM